MPRYRAVTFDIDGTLTIGHGWFYIAEMLGRGGEYRKTTAAYRSGSIGEDEHLSNLLNMAAGCSVGMVEEALERTPKLDNIAEGIRVLEDNGFRTFLLTHNPQYVCRWYASRYGLHGYGCAEQPVQDGMIGRADGIHADKGAWLARLCRREGIDPSQTIHAGDSESDALIFRLAGLGIGVNSRNSSVRTLGRACVNTTDMMDVVESILSAASE